MDCSPQKKSERVVGGGGRRKKPEHWIRSTPMELRTERCDAVWRHSAQISRMPNLQLFHTISVDPARCDFEPLSAFQKRHWTVPCGGTPHSEELLRILFLSLFHLPRKAKKLLDFNFPCCWTVFPSLSNFFFYFARRSLSCPDWLCNIRSVDELLMRSHFSTLHRRNMNAVVGEIRNELVPSIIKFPTSKRSSLSHTYRAALCNHRPTQAQSVSFRLDDIHSTESVSFFSSLLFSAPLLSWASFPNGKKIHQIGVENHILTKLSKSVEHRARNEKVAKILIRVIINSILVEI